MARARRARGTSPLAVFGIVVLVLVVLGGAWAAWVYVGSTMLAERAHTRGIAELEERWRAPVEAEAEAELPPPTLGEPAWILEIPAIDLRVPIIAGTGPAELRSGVGWYPTSNRPGEVGNVGIAGNRVGDGEPFRRLLELQAGDEVVVETHIKRYTYAVRVAPADLTVTPEDSWVLDPVPGEDFDPHEAVLTLTTEQDLYPTPDRSVGFAVLVKEEPQ
ncbi:MAG: class E sortase [Propionibacterium sp.]|nr:class E sortase [Propionibacterium sp.]